MPDEKSLAELVGSTNPSDPYPFVKKLDLILEELQDQRDLLEELVEKVADLGTGAFNSGYNYD